MLAKPTFAPLLTLAAAMALQSNASPIVKRDSTQPATEWKKGSLRVIQYDVTNQVSFNKTADIREGYLQIVNENTTPWHMLVGVDGGADNVDSLLHAGDDMCLAAHKPHGNSYLHLAKCPTGQNLDYPQLKDINAKQLWHVQSFADPGSEKNTYKLVLNGKYGPITDGEKIRTNVKVLEDNQHVHIENDTYHSQLGKHLYFIADN